MLDKLVETTNKLKKFNFIEEVQNVPNLSPIEQTNWLKKSGVFLQKTEALENLTLMVQASILYHVSELWKDLKKEVTSPWEYDFYKWAKAYTQRRAQSPSEQTINNKITVYRDWVADSHIPYPPKVYLPKRDEKGQIIGDLIEEEQWIEVDFDPMQTDYGKLLIARGAARRGDITEDAWAAIMDPYATSRELKEYLTSESSLDRETPQNDNKQEKEEEDKEFEVYERDAVLYAKQNGDTIAICTFNTENADEPLYKKAAARLLQMFGLEPSLALFEDMGEVVIIK